MLPSKQRLKARHPSLIQVHNGLVNQPELFAIERLTQIPFDLQTRHGLLMHGFVEDDKAGAPAGLGLQHGSRGITQQMFSAFISGMTARNADAGSQEDFALSRDKRRRKLLLN